MDLQFAPSGSRDRHGSLEDELASFSQFGQATRLFATEAPAREGSILKVPTYVNEFWTARQRQANSLHEISYRACFKPQLPDFSSNGAPSLVTSFTTPSWDVGRLSLKLPCWVAFPSDATLTRSASC